MDTACRQQKAKGKANQMPEATRFVARLLAGAVALLLAGNGAWAGSLSGAFRGTTTATVNLTAGGLIDWAHWGANNPGSFNHKAGVTQQISNATVIGGMRVQVFDNNLTRYSWTDGSPLQKSSGLPRGIFVEGRNAGFELSVVADTTVKTLNVYVGAYATRMHFEAALSDHSTTGYTNTTFQNSGDGPNRIYTLNFAANSANQRLTVRYWSLTSSGNVTLLAASLREAAPLLEVTQPASGSIFYPVANGLEFKASTGAPFSLPKNQIRLLLNDRDVSTELAVTGNSTSLAAKYSKLEPERFYRAQLSAVDSNGLGKTNVLVFDTFSHRGSTVIEAEDYNYAGGSFADPPALDAYQGRQGLSGVDFSLNAHRDNTYRDGDPVGLQTAGDVLRKAYTDAGLLDYQIQGLQPGDWLNYTRTFPAGRHHVYLRYAGDGATQQLQLSRVTSDPTLSDQKVDHIGTLNLSGTGGETAFRYTVLADDSGRPLVVNLAGVQTLRLTRSESSSATPVAMRLNYLVVAPAATAPPSLWVTSNGTDVIVSFLTEVGFIYASEFKNQLNEAAWQNYSPKIVGDGAIKSVIHPQSGPARFFRVLAH